VYIVLQAPYGWNIDPRRIIRRVVLPPGFLVTQRSVMKAEVMRPIAAVNAKLRAIAEDTGARALDPLDSLCPGETCPVVAPDGAPVYFDFGHIRPAYAREHVGFLDEAVLGAGPDNAP